jgi:hypothetical protein
MIDIIYIATDDYSKYFDGFAETLKYFLPGVPKTLKVLSNVERDYSVENEDIVKVEFIKIFDLFYPCINLNKTNFINQILGDSDSEYIFYFDADTKFLPVNNAVWDNLKYFLDYDFFCISIHPFYQLKDSVEWKENGIKRFYNEFTTKDETQNSYIPQNEYTYIISSFFCANKHTMKRVCDKIDEMTRGDLRRENGYRIPLFLDENYFNRLIFNAEFLGDKTYNFKVGEYIILNGCESNINSAETFLLQKNFADDFKRLRM